MGGEMIWPFWFCEDLFEGEGWLGWGEDRGLIQLLFDMWLLPWKRGM